MSNVLSTREHTQKRFCIRPIMANTYEINMLMAYKVGKVFAIALTMIVVGVIVYFLFFDNTVYYPSELKYVEIMKYGGGMVATVLFVWIMVVLLEFCHKYMEKTKYVFYQDRICINHLWKKEKVLTYEALGRYLAKRKVRVCNGRFEFLYKGGKIPVYTWGDEPTSPEFYRFINEQCGTRIPEITKEDNEVVRKNGRGFVYIYYVCIPLVCLSIGFGFVGSISEIGLNFGVEFWRYYVHYFFSPANIFGIMGALALVSGLLAKVRGYVLARKHFQHCKSDIKVTFF